MKDTDYRVVRWHTSGKDTFAIYQVWYDENNNVKSIADEPANLQADTTEQLKDMHFHIAAAYLQPLVEGHLYKSPLENSSVMDTLSYLTKNFWLDISTTM